MLRFLTLLLTILIFISSASSISAAASDKCPSGDCKPNPFSDNANTINLGTQLTGSGLGIPPTEGIVATILKNVLVIFFTVGGISTIIYFIWGAVDWILSGGDKEKVSNARKKMTNALIGLVLLSLSFVIIRVIGQIVGFNPLETVQIRKLNE